MDGKLDSSDREDRSSSGDYGYPPAARRPERPPYRPVPAYPSEAYDQPERRPSRIARKVNYDDDGRHAAKPGPPSPPRRPRSRGPMPLYLELPLLLIVAFCLAVLIRTFLVQAYFIPSGSMEHTLDINDRVLVNKVVYDVRGFKRGEIIVFKGTGIWHQEEPDKIKKPTTLLGKFGHTFSDLIGLSQPNEKDFIKRIIGLPGDHVSCCDPQGRVIVNGQPIDEPYIFEPATLVDPNTTHVCLMRNFKEVIVPPGQLFVMGDHRSVSLDSRCSGTVPTENVIGRAFVVVWPKKQWKMLPTPQELSNVPATVAAGQPAQPLPGAPGTAEGVVGLPILASLAISARSARIRRRQGRRLRS
jgi:signal peptidase I